MTKKSSGNKWIKGHLADRYVKLANKENMKSRASYKLKQINDKYGVIKSGDIVIDLGAAPGGWSQVASGIVGGGGLVISVDLLPISGIAGAMAITGDVFSEEVAARIDELLRERESAKADLVMSDMAPNLTGIASTDAARSFELNMRALFFASRCLKKSGSFIVKLFRNENFDDYLKEVKAVFSSYSVYKPDASRSKSSEIYIVAKHKISG